MDPTHAPALDAAAAAPSSARLLRARGSRAGRPTIGLLTHGSGDPCSPFVWQGVAAVAAEQDANLVCLPAKPVRSRLGFEAQANVLYDLVSPGSVDAVVAWVAGMTISISLEEARAVLERYRPLPVVTAGGLLDKRGARFSALVAASDNMAIGAMKTLQARGYRIPADIAIAGLDDESQSRLLTPPLTTGPLHFYDQARQAAEAALALLRGEEAPARVVLSTELLVRQSCGCPDRAVVRAAAGGSLSRWHGALSALREQALPFAAGDRLAWLENLCQQARVVIGETAQRVHAYQVLLAEEQTRQLAEVSQTLSTAIDWGELADLIVKAVAQLAIPTCYLALYEDPAHPAGLCRLLIAYSDGRRLDAEGRTYPAQLIVPRDLLPTSRRYSLVVEPLYFRADQLGFVVFEADPGRDEVYDILRGEISGALKRTQLAAHNVELYNKAAGITSMPESVDTGTIVINKDNAKMFYHK